MPQETHPEGRGISPRRENKKALSGKKGRSLLLAIGIDQYQHIGGLHNAVRDVDYLIEVLTRRYQFDKQWAAKHKLVNEAATLGNISQQFHHLAEAAKPEDEVLIYFSGHGSFNRTIDRGYWIPYDGKPDETHTLFSNSTLVDFVASIKSKHVVLIVDSCFSGSFFGGVRKFDLPERLSSIPSRWVLTSGRNEVVSDGAPGRNSPFAESLIYHLNANNSRGFRITELFPRIIEQVATNAEQLPQCEPIRNVGHKGGEFIFRLRGGQSAPVSLPENYQGKLAAPPPATGISVGRRIKVMVAIAAALLTVLAVWRIAVLQGGQMEEAPVYRKEIYGKILPMPERGFIVARNDSFGYADKDTLDWIPLLYQEAHPFTENLARVKKGGKYGWIDAAGKERIAFQYDSAGDFQGDSAQVSLGGRSFLIGRDGQEIVVKKVTKTPVNPDPQQESNTLEKKLPLPPSLQANKTEINLGGSETSFSLTVANSGGTMARNLQVITSNGIENRSESRFNLGAGQSKTLRFRLNANGLPAGNFNGYVRVESDNLSGNVDVPVSAKVVASQSETETPAQPIVAIMQARCNLGKPNCRVSFYDKIQRKTLEFTTDGSGNATYAIAEGLVGESVDVSYCGSGPLRIRVRENGCISLPQ